jgi:hypothetical protein
VGGGGTEVGAGGTPEGVVGKLLPCPDIGVTLGGGGCGGGEVGRVSSGGRLGRGGGDAVGPGRKGRTSESEAATLGFLGETGGRSPGGGGIVGAEAGL